LAVLPKPPVTEESRPLAVLLKPPLTEEEGPLAVLSPPPRIDSSPVLAAAHRYRLDRGRAATGVALTTFERSDSDCCNALRGEAPRISPPA
jgi:hypothetical protein